VKNIKVLLLHIPQKPDDKNSLIQAAPLGFIGLGNFIKDNCNVTVSICNMASFRYENNKGLIEYIEDKSYDLIGISLQWHFQIYSVIETCKEIKNISRPPIIVLGGFTASWFGEEILSNYSQVDFIIKGDGEVPFVKLIENLCSEQYDYHNVPNLIWRSGSSIIANNLDFVATSDFLNRLNDWDFSIYDNDVSEYVGYTSGDMNITCKKDYYYFLPVGRGCPLTCAFCAGSKENQIKSFGRESVALRSPERVFYTMQKVYESGIKNFYICFDVPNMDDNWYTKLFKLIRESGIIISIAFECYDLPSKTFLKNFANSLDLSYSSLALSPTSMSDNIRKEFTSQRYTFSELEETIYECKELGILVYLYFSLLPVSEDKEWDLFNIKIDWILRNNTENVRASIIPIKMEPGSPWFIHPEKYIINKTISSFNDFYEHHKFFSSNHYYLDLGYEFKEAKARVVYYNSIINEVRILTEALQKKEKNSSYVWIEDINVLRNLNSYNNTLSKNIIVIFNDISKNVSLNEIIDCFDFMDFNINSVVRISRIQEDIIQLTMLEFLEQVEIVNNEFALFNFYKDKKVLIIDQCKWISATCIAQKGKSIGINENGDLVFCDNKNTLDKGINKDCCISSVYDELMHKRGCKTCTAYISCPKCVKSETSEYCKVHIHSHEKINIMRYFIENYDLIQKIMNKYIDSSIFFNFKLSDNEQIEFYENQNVNHYIYNKIFRKLYKVKAKN
jgi:radical SAM superfamily enzyme YgiQ (UPF0313 family)